ncbi:MAG: hypothetical protein ACRC45_03610 [Cetobacterium sp.]
MMIPNTYKLRELLKTSKGATVYISKEIGNAKAKMRKSEYKDFIAELEISKDIVSIALKRFRMLELGFTEEFVQDCTDREIKKITHKQVETTESLVIARTELARGEISYVDFCEEFDKFKVVKTDNEKLISKAEGLCKFIENSECNDESLTAVANMFQPLVKQWSLIEDTDLGE